MGFRGFYQKLCVNGHYWTTDVWDRCCDTCDECEMPTAWENLVDETNDEVEGYIELECIRSGEDPPRYVIPVDKGIIVDAFSDGGGI